MSEEWLGFCLLANESPQAPEHNWTLCTTICKADSDWGSFYGWGTRAGLEFYPQNKRFYVLVDGSVHPPGVSLLAWAARDAFNTDMIWIPAIANYIINCNPQKSVAHSLLHSTLAWDSISTLYSKNRVIFRETNSILIAKIVFLCLCLSYQPAEFIEFAASAATLQEIIFQGPTWWMILDLFIRLFLVIGSLLFWFIKRNHWYF